MGLITRGDVSLTATGEDSEESLSLSNREDDESSSLGEELEGLSSDSSSEILLTIRLEVAFATNSALPEDDCDLMTLTASDMGVCIFRYTDDDST